MYHRANSRQSELAQINALLGCQFLKPHKHPSFAQLCLTVFGFSTTNLFRKNFQQIFQLIKAKSAQIHDISGELNKMAVCVHAH